MTLMDIGIRPRPDTISFSKPQQHSPFPLAEFQQKDDNARNITFELRLLLQSPFYLAV